MADLISVFASARFSRLLENLAANVVKPTMIETAESAIFDPPITEIRPPVGAMEPQQSWTPLIITEQRQFFAQNFYF
jgi:hypothetical protein